MNRYQDLLPPLWSIVALTVATLVTNWIWASWFGKAGGPGLVALMIYSLLGWPLTLALIYLALAYALRLLENLGFLRILTVLGVVAAGIAVYGMPGPWNLLICAVTAISVGVQLRRLAQDEADLEDL